MYQSNSLSAALSWFFVSEDTEIVSGVGYKCVANKPLTLTLSNNQGSKPFKGAQYLCSSDEFETRLDLREISTFHKYGKTRAIFIPSHTTIGFLCHSVDPLKFTITNITGTVNLFIEH